MMHLIVQGSQPLRYISCGNLINEDGFQHTRRKLDSFVLLFGIRGEMRLNQDGRPLLLRPNSYVILFPGMEHMGTQPCQGELSYFWCHFDLAGSRSQAIRTQELMQHMARRYERQRPWDVYILSEQGSLTEHGRVELLFHQLLDITREPALSSYAAHYALSLLMMEISTQFYLAGVSRSLERSKSRMRIHEVSEWLRTHYAEDCSLQALGKRFAYHPTYLSAAFKKEMGVGLLEHITQLRIDAAKDLLMSDMRVRDIAAACGFRDEKHFMKVFKAMEYATPSQYRYSFGRRKVNKA